MKKSVTVCFAAMLTFSSVPIGLAAQQPSVNSVFANVTKEDEETVKRPVVSQLTLQDAMKYGIESDYSLMEIEYALQELRFTEDVVDENYDDTEDNLEALRDAYNALSLKIEEEKKAGGENPTSPDSASVEINNYDKKISSSTDILLSL